MPTLYQGAAEHIARVTRPALVVAFYTGLAETQATVNVIVAHPSVSPRIEPNDVEGIGVLLVEQCKLARQILSSAPIVRGTDSDLVAQMLRIIIKRLDEEIAASAGVFPTAPQYETKTKVG